MHRPLLLLLSGLMTAVLCATAAAPAWAHTRLVSSTPAEGVPVEAPREVSLVFSEPVQPVLSVVSVTGADGEELTEGPPTASADGASVSQALRSPLAPGTYRVAYRVLAADGHPVTGTFEITATGAPAAPAPGTAAGTPTPAPAAAPDGDAAPALRPTAATDGDGNGVPVLLLVLGGLVVASLVGLLARRLGGAPPSA